MANTLYQYTNLINAKAMDKVFNVTATFSDFTTMFTNEQMDRYKSSLKVPLLSSGSALVENPTTFGGGTTGSVLVNVDLTHLHVPFYVSNAEYVNGYELADLVATNAQVLVDGLQAKVLALMSTSNYSVGLSAADTAMSLANLQTAWSSIPGRDKVAYMDSIAFSKLLTNGLTVQDPMQGAPYAGFKRVAYADNFTTGIGTAGVWGFVTTKPGVVVASGIPKIAPLAQKSIDSTLVDLGNGLTAVLNIWGDTADRSDNASLDIYFGCAKGDGNACKLLKV